MKIYDLDKLVTDDNQDGLYNMFDPTFRFAEGYPTTEYVVPLDREMRIDLICLDIYGDVNNIDFLIKFNSIDNPLNVMVGDSIRYVDFEAIDQFRTSVVDNKNSRKTLLNVNKTTKKDENRKKYIEDSYSVPPTYQEVPQPSVQIKDNQIVIGE